MPCFVTVSQTMSEPDIGSDYTRRQKHKKGQKIRALKHSHKEKDRRAGEKQRAHEPVFSLFSCAVNTTYMHLYCIKQIATIEWIRNANTEESGYRRQRHATRAKHNVNNAFKWTQIEREHNQEDQ